MPALLLRYLPHALIGAVLVAGALYLRASLIEQGRAELRPKVEQLSKELAEERADRKRAEEASSAYQNELQALRSRPRVSTPVRLCRPAAVPESSFSTTGSHDSTAPSWVGVGSPRADFEAGPDIGPELRDLAAQCDASNAQLRALQKWASAGK